MKYFIIILLFSCNIVTAMQTVTLENFKAQKDGERIVASARVKGTQEIFSVEQNQNNALYIFKVKPNKNAEPNTEGVLYKAIINDRPELRSAFKQKIDAFQE